MPTVMSMLSRNASVLRRVRQQPAVAGRHVSGREIQAGQLHAGVFDGTDELVDLAIRWHRGGERPPEFDSVEPGVPRRLRSLQQWQFGQQDRAVHGVGKGIHVLFFRFSFGQDSVVLSGSGSPRYRRQPP